MMEDMASNARFDAQCSELFLYTSVGNLLTMITCFDAQCFELFLYSQSQDLKRLPLFTGFDAQCFELFLYIKSYKRSY